MHSCRLQTEHTNISPTVGRRLLLDHKSKMTSLKARRISTHPKDDTYCGVPNSHFIHPYTIWDRDGVEFIENLGIAMKSHADEIHRVIHKHLTKPHQQDSPTVLTIARDRYELLFTRDECLVEVFECLLASNNPSLMDPYDIKKQLLDYTRTQIDSVRLDTEPRDLTDWSLLVDFPASQQYSPQIRTHHDEYQITVHITGDDNGTIVYPCNDEDQITRTDTFVEKMSNSTGLHIADPNSHELNSFLYDFGNLTIPPPNHGKYHPNYSPKQRYIPPASILVLPFRLPHAEPRVSSVLRCTLLCMSAPVNRLHAHCINDTLETATTAWYKITKYAWSSCNQDQRKSLLAMLAGVTIQDENDWSHTLDPCIARGFLEFCETTKHQPRPSFLYEILSESEDIRRYNHAFIDYRDPRMSEPTYWDSIEYVQRREH